MSKLCVFLFVICKSLINSYLTMKNDTYIGCDLHFDEKMKKKAFFFIIIKKYSKLFLLFIDISEPNKPLTPSMNTSHFILVIRFCI